MSTTTWLVFSSLVLVGFTACAEFGSFAFVHPVIRALPARQQVAFEKGLLRTFGRVMPVLMTLAPIVAGSLAARLTGGGRVLAAASAGVMVVALVATISVNVGINSQTGTWHPDNPPAHWESIRRRWDRWQGVRATLLLVGFVLLCAAVGVVSS